MKHKPMPNLDELRWRLQYNAWTGQLFWRNSKMPFRNGSQTGTAPDSKGYGTIMYNQVVYRTHRLLFYYVTGIDPQDNQIDHKNLNIKDNRFINLRLADNSTNQMNQRKYRNNKSGFKGVYLKKDNGKYAAEIQHNNKTIFLGYYQTAFYAAVVYNRMARKLFGKFYRLR